MQYQGGKTFIAKQILPLVLKERETYQWYVEPFAGGMNVVDKVQGNRIANDIDKPLITLYKALQEGWEPPDHITREEYKHIKDNQQYYPEELLAFVGYGCSFGAKWFGGYACRGGKRAAESVCLGSKKILLKQTERLKGCVFSNLSYKDLEIPDNSIIYCDPPYKNTLGYKIKFDHEEFYNWCREQKQKGHQIFISEFQMPEDFICIWEKERKITTARKDYHTRIERLYIL